MDGAEETGRSNRSLGWGSACVWIPVVWIPVVGIPQLVGVAVS